MKTWLNKRKKLLGKILVFLAIFVISFSFNKSSDAAERTIITTPTECDRLGGEPTPIPGDSNVSCTYDDAAPPPTGGGGGATDTGYTPEAQPAGTGDVAQKTSCIYAVGINFQACGLALANLILVFFSSTVALAGLLLDMAINITIVQFKSWVEGVGAIRIAWELFRDALNITLIFVLLYAGIKMILGLGTPAKILRGVIIAGLLINFSYFFTSVIIDISNVATVEINKAVSEIGDKFNEKGQIVTYGGIAGALMEGLSPQNTYKQLPDGSQDADERDMALLIKIIFGIVLFLIISLVLGVIALMLFVRFIMLIVLLVTSPIMVISNDLLPQLSAWRKKWWSELISQAVFAPLMLLFIAVTILIVQDPKFGTFTPAIRADAGFFGKLILDIAGNLVQAGIVIGILIVGLVVSKSFAGQMGGSLTGWAEKKARSIATAPGNFVARNAVGRISRGAGNLYDGKMGQWQQASGWRRGVATTARALPVDRILRDTLKAGEGVKFGGTESLADIEKYEKSRTEGLNKKGKEADAERQARLDAQNKLRNGLSAEQARIAENITNMENERSALATQLATPANTRYLDQETHRKDQERLQALDKKIAENRAQQATLNTPTGAAAFQESLKKEVKSEGQVRKELAEATTALSAEAINGIQKVVDSVKDIKDENVRAVEIRKKLDEKQLRYYDSMQELADLQKKKDAYEKSFEARFAGVYADSSGVNGELADEIRKKQAQGKKDKAFKAIKDALDREGVTIDSDGNVASTTNNNPTP